MLASSVKNASGISIVLLLTSSNHGGDMIFSYFLSYNLSFTNGIQSSRESSDFHINNFHLNCNHNPLRSVQTGVY